MISVRFYAKLREIAGRDAVDVDFQPGGTVNDLLNKLDLKIPGISEKIVRSRSAASVNREFAQYDTVLCDGDEVAFLPPLSGGSQEDRAVRIQTGDFTVDEEIAKIAEDVNTGGTVVFLGTARQFSRGRRIDRLEFEHYPGMAESKLKRLRRQAIELFDVNDVGIVHRVGSIGIGENIVLIAVAAEHREAAFDACRWCIGELKKTVPIWKKEITAEGDFWVEERP